MGVKGLRAAGSGMLLFVACKVVLMDSAVLAVPYRIASFIGLGAILLVASFAYARLRAHAAGATPVDVPTSP